MFSKLKPYLASDVGMLTISGGLAQVLNLLAYPFLTRLYTPEAFGIFSAITALATFAGSVALLRLDMIIQIADEDEEPAILTAAISIAGASAALIVFLAYTFAPLVMPEGDLSTTQIPSPAVLAALVCVSALLNALFAFGRQYAAKKVRFRRIALAQILRTILAVSAQFCLVLLFPGPIGLAAGFAFGALVAVAILWPWVSREFWPDFGKPEESWTQIKTVLGGYREMIMVDSVNILVAASVLIAYPLLIISLYGAKEAGFFGLASRLTFIPLEVLAGAISTVYFQRIALAIREKQGAKRLFLRTVGLSVFLAATICAGFAIVIEWAIDLIFDPRWSPTAVLVMCLLPTLAARLMISSISSTPLALRRPRILLVWNLVQIAIIGLATFLARGESIESFLLLSGFGLLIATVAYLAYLWSILRTVQ